MTKHSSNGHAGAKRTGDHTNQVLFANETFFIAREALGTVGNIGLGAFFSTLSSSHLAWAPWLGVLTAAIYLLYLYLHCSERARKSQSTRRKFKYLFFITITLSIGFAVIIHRNPSVIFPNPSPPELFLDARVSSFVPGKPVIIASLVNNTGGTTAYKINLCSETTIEPPSFQGPLQFGMPSPNQEKTVPPMLPPRISALRVSSSRGTVMAMTDKRIEALTNNRALFFFFGRGEYFDQDGRNYQIDFCFLYDPQMLEGLMAVCPKQYWPSTEDPNRNCSPN